MKRRNKIFVSFNSIDDVNGFVKKVVHELTASYANDPNSSGSIVYGFSVRIDNRLAHLAPNSQQQAQAARREPQKEPLIDIIDRPGGVSVLAELPGLDKSSLVVAADHSKLKISCSWSGGTYIRSVNLPNSVNPKSASATYNNGVLEITFEKSESASSEMRITLN